jgi:hypothetical protein
MPALIRGEQIDSICADLQMLKALRLDAIDAPGLTPDEVQAVFESRRKALLTRLENKGIQARDDPPRRGSRMGDRRILLPMQCNNFGNMIVLPGDVRTSGSVLVCNNIGYGYQPKYIRLPHQIYENDLDVLEGEISVHSIGSSVLVRR